MNELHIKNRNNKITFSYKNEVKVKEKEKKIIKKEKFNKP